jgi:hypothetical protein
LRNRPPCAARVCARGHANHAGLAGYAKVLCSAVFVSGREPAEAFKNSGFFLFPDEHRAGVTYAVDRDKKLVRMTHGARRDGEVLRRSGLHHPSAGSRRHLFHTGAGQDTRCRTRDAAVADGRRAVAGAASAGSTRRVAKAVDLAFADPEALTAGMVVLYKGQIVAERYMPGSHQGHAAGKLVMGKSLTATLFALLVKQGVYKIDDPVPVPEWRAPGDPRGAIRIVDLLHMSSGLRFIAGQDPDYSPDKGYPDHTLVYTGAIRRVHAFDDAAAGSFLPTPKAAIAIRIR